MFVRIKTSLLLAEDPLGKNHFGSPFIHTSLFLSSLQRSKTEEYTPSGSVTEETLSCGGRRTIDEGGEGVRRERRGEEREKREGKGGRGETSIKGPTSNRGFFW